MKNIALTSLAALALSSPVFAANFQGPRIEAHGGWDRVQAKVSYDGASEKGHDNGFVYGGEAGYDLRANNFVFGVLAGIDGSTVKECANGGTERLCIKAGRDIEAGARAGFLVTPRVLLYGKVSYANVQVRARYTDSAIPTDNFSGHDERSGIRVGAGVEQQISKMVYAKLEYRYTDYKDYRADIGGDVASLGLSRNQVLAGVGVRF